METLVGISPSELVGKLHEGQSDTPGLSTLEMQRLLDAHPKLLDDKINAIVASQNANNALVLPKGGTVPYTPAGDYDPATRKWVLEQVVSAGSVTEDQVREWNSAKYQKVINGSFIVWQRGTSFTAPSNAYGPDRFKLNGSGTAAKHSSGAGMTITGTLNVRYWMEAIDFLLLPDPVVMYWYDGTLHSKSTAKSSITKSSGNALIFDENITNATLQWVNISPYAPSKNYGEQLALCQRYGLELIPYLKIRASRIQTDQLYFFYPTPVTLRAVPIIVNPENLAIYQLNSSGSGSGWTFVAGAIGQNGVEIVATKANHGLSDGYLGFPYSPTTTFLDAEIY